MRITLAIALLCLSACGSNETTTQVGETTFVQNDKDGTTTIKHESNSITALNGPDAQGQPMPNYAPKYPNSTITSTLKTQNDEGQSSTMVSFTSSDKLATVAEFYTKSFTANGMVVKTNLITPESVMIVSEGNGKNASILASIEEGKTQGVLTFQ